MPGLFNGLNPFGRNSHHENASQATLASSEDNESFSFVEEVVDIDVAASLKLKVTPLNNVIGMGRTSDKMTQLCATITACDLPDDKASARSPVDIVVALDISGSMGGKKLDLCKHTLKLLLRELRPQDRFGLVTFEDEAKIVIPTRRLTKQGKQDALHKIQKIHVLGCTNLSGGVSLAAQEIRAVEEPNSVRTIFLLTDGQANRGVCDSDGIVSLTRGCINTDEVEPPTTIHCFGYGSDHDENLLREISQTTAGGTYYFVDSDSNVATSFGDALGGILSVVAQSCTLNITVPDETVRLGVKIANLHHDSATRNGDGSYSINIGDFYAEESRDVLLEVSLANAEANCRQVDAGVPHVAVSMAFTDTIKKGLISGVKAVGYIKRPIGSEMSAPNSHVVLQWLRVRTTQVMAKAKEAASNDNLPNARGIINSHLKVIHQEARSIDADSDPLVIQMIIDLNEVIAGLSTQSSYDTYGRQYMSNRIHTHTIQRCADAGANTMNVYRSRNKAKMSLKFSGQK